MEELMLKIENVKKEYKLGQIGGTTLREELQRVWAKIRKKEDPTKKIGAKNYNQGEKFLALNGVSFEVKKGERVGIIGHNGAGKSTLLKLISRITAPTNGTISLNGRVASMLEVGTGFHPELTGRENIYMNGAILGMTKKEIDSKIEDMVDFSEVRQFIDTPVKRYSSGMYVKLAFSVAAHLDSEIMIMDEVLAVGDMAFQQKCLEKMSQVSQDEGRTILYVSHNMNTIRQLCDRVIVLDHGQVLFDGDVEEGINIYLSNKNYERQSSFINLDDRERPRNSFSKVKMHSVKLKIADDCIIKRGQDLAFILQWEAFEKLDNVRFRMIIRNASDLAVGLTVSDVIEKECVKDNIYTNFVFKTDLLAEGRYFFSIALFQNDDLGNSIILDHISRAFSVQIIEDVEKDDYLSHWEARWWGNIHFPKIDVK